MQRLIKLATIFKNDSDELFFLPSGEAGSTHISWEDVAHLLKEPAQTNKSTPSGQVVRVATPEEVEAQQEEAKDLSVEGRLNAHKKRVAQANQ